MSELKVRPPKEGDWPRAPDQFDRCACPLPCAKLQFPAVLLRFPEHALAGRPQRSARTPERELP